MASIAQDFINGLTQNKDLKELFSKNYADTILENELKDLFSKWPSMYELMPDRFYLDKEARSSAVLVLRFSNFTIMLVDR